MSKQKTEVKERPYFEEWNVRIREEGTGKYDRNDKEIKRKVVTKAAQAPIKPRVLISEEQAIVLNAGTINGFSTDPKMYFEPGCDEPILHQKELA